MLSYRLYHFRFGIGKIIRSFFQLAVLLLAGSSSYNYNSRGGFPRCFLGNTVGKRHLLLRPGFRTPAFTEIERILFVPFLINAEQLFVHLYTGISQTVCYTDDFRYIHHTAGACSAFIIVELYASENCCAFFSAYRQRVFVVFEQYYTLRNDILSSFDVLVPVECF